MALFSFNRIKSDERDFRSTLNAIRGNDFALIHPAACWGVFSGLFGIGSNELILMIAGAADEVDAASSRIDTLDGVRVVARHGLEPTVRPLDATPLDRAGLYVFRFFDVLNRDVEKIAALSKDAWETFEGVDSYRAEPQGLFCEHPRDAERGIMLLLTWYDGLNSWQVSRQPSPEARENFRLRHELTLGTIAFATRLITD